MKYVQFKCSESDIGSLNVLEYVSFSLLKQKDIDSSESISRATAKVNLTKAGYFTSSKVFLRSEALPFGVNM